MQLMDDLTGNKISFLHDTVIKGRELFISDATDTYPVSLLRYVIRVCAVTAAVLWIITIPNNTQEIRDKREREREFAQIGIAHRRLPNPPPPPPPWASAIVRQHPTRCTRLWSDCVSWRLRNRLIEILFLSPSLSFSSSSSFSVTCTRECTLLFTL